MMMAKSKSNCGEKVKKNITISLIIPCVVNIKRYIILTYHITNIHVFGKTKVSLAENEYQLSVSHFQLPVPCRYLLKT